MENQLENGQPVEENDNPDWPEVILEMFTNREFLDFAERTVDKFVDVVRTKGANEERYMSNTRLFLWQKFALSVFALLGLGAAAWYRLLQPEWIYTLVAGVIASLFVPPRRG